MGKKKSKDTIWTKKEIRILMQNAADNMDNLKGSFRETSLKLKTHSAEACRYKYYRIRQDMGKLPTLKRILISRGFFMLSKNKVYVQGKNSARTQYKALWLTEEGSKNIVNSINEKGK